MPIEVEIPLEITDYKRKVILGLSLRQLATLPIAIVVSILSFIILVNKLGMTIDNASWFIMLLAVPPLSIGFLQPNGEPFERWFLRKLHRLLEPQKLYYSTDMNTSEKEVTHHVSKKEQPICECRWIYSCTNASARKRRRKEIAKRLKAEQKAYKQKKRN